MMRGDFDEDEDEADDPMDYCPYCGAHVSEEHEIDCDVDVDVDDDDR